MAKQDNNYNNMENGFAANKDEDHLVVRYTLHYKEVYFRIMLSFIFSLPLHFECLIQLCSSE